MSQNLLTENWSHELLGPLKNRVVMSAMSRGFAHQHCCTDEMRNYYTKRAVNGVALIITEGAIVHPSGDGYQNVPHMWEKHHAASWQETVDLVHKAGSKIACQLWHCGRISHQDFTGGLRPISSTNRPAEGINRQNGKPFATPRRMGSDEVDDIISCFINAGRLSLDTGFDFIELHLGHGYLIDQFFDSRINDRTDEYGGSIQNRCRFGVELVHQAVSTFGADRVIVRLSPSREMDGLYEWPDLTDMLYYLIPTLANCGLKILDISCARANYYNTSGKIIRMVRTIWPGIIIGGASLTHAQAESELRDNLLDLVTWGRLLISNPDLVTRIDSGLPFFEFSPEMLRELN